MEAGKVAVAIPAFRLRKKKAIPAEATHYRLVSCVLTIDFEKRTYKHEKQEGALQAMGRKTGEAFCIEQVVQPANEQGCFWLLGMEFYRMANDKPKLVRGGALRVMEWVGKASPIERISVVPEVVGEMAYEAPNEVLARDCVEAGAIETGVEEIGAAYRAYMEELLAEACLKVVEVEVTAAAPADNIVDVVDKLSAEPVSGEVDEALTGTDEEFEKSLRVLLPVKDRKRREMESEGTGIQPIDFIGEDNLMEPPYEPA